MDPRDAALTRAHEHALAWLDSLDTRPVPPQAQPDEVAGALGSGPAGRTRATRPRSIDLLRPRQRARADRDAVGPVLRLRHRRHAPGRAGRRLAGQRLGPERRAGAGSRPPHTAVEDVAAPGCSTCSGCRRPRGRLRHRRDDGQLHLPGRRPGRGAAAGRLGHRPDGLVGAPRVRVLVGEERHDTVDLALRYLGLGAPEAGRGRRPGADPPGRARRPRWPSGDGPTIVASRPATSTPAPSTRSPSDRGSRTSTAPGCTSTAPSGCSPPPRPATGT